MGAHKTSMLQDLEAGRPMEIGALIGAVVELGEILDVPMPYTKSVYACAKLLSQVRESRAAAILNSRYFKAVRGFLCPHLLLKT